jgi:hypothetical protein
VTPTSIVVAFRVPLAGVFAEPPYLVRARQLCAEAEAAGARLVAWSATLVAMAWDLDEVKDAIDVASRVRADGVAVEGAWACGIAQGPLETLSPEGHRLHLAWGEPLVVAASLARIARPGEVLIDGDVVAVRSGSLVLTGSRSASDGGRRVRGWQLDLDRPWRGSPAGSVERGDAPSVPWLEELAGADVLELIEAPISPQTAGEDLARLERERRGAEGRPPSERCRASLALAVGLAAVARPEDALIATLDALARAREDGESKALAACYALLAKIYAGVGKVDAAGELGALAALAANQAGVRA